MKNRFTDRERGYDKKPFIVESFATLEIRLKNNLESSGQIRGLYLYLVEYFSVSELNFKRCKFNARARPVIFKFRHVAWKNSRTSILVRSVSFVSSALYRNQVVKKRSTNSKETGALARQSNCL